MEVLDFASPATSALFRRTPEQCAERAEITERLQQKLADRPDTDVTSLVNRAMFTRFGVAVKKSIHAETKNELGRHLDQYGRIENCDVITAGQLAVDSVITDLEALDLAFRRRQALTPVFPGRQREFARLHGESRGMF